MARRVQLLKAPYNHHWKHASAVTCWRETGVYLVKDEVADEMIAKGYAIPIEPEPSRNAPAQKPKVTRRRTSRKKAGDESPTNTGRSDRVDREDLVAPDRADDSASLAASG